MGKILSLLVIIGSVTAAHAQGYFNGSTSFSDTAGDGSKGTIYDGGIVDNTTPAGYAYAAGSIYHCQYYVGATTTNPSTLAPIGAVGSPATGALAGYYQPGTVATGNNFGPGSAVTVQLRAWKGGAASYESALFAGMPTGVSGLVNLTLHDAQTPGPNITTMSNIILPGPEPATMVLGLIGAGALCVRRRK
jgi:hypothetical protein